MFYSISGEVVHMELNLAVIEAGGVGYAVSTSSQTLGRLTKGQRATLYTHFYLREGMAELFGFCGKEELNTFKLLIGVSGVGPKAALSILSVNSPERLALALLSGDEKALTAAPGVGKKLAQRVILELKDKIGGGSLPGDRDVSGSAPLTAGGSPLAEAQAALVVLGYTPTDAAMALKGLDESQTAEDLIRLGLGKLSKFK